MQRTLSFLLAPLMPVLLGSCSVLHTVPHSDVTTSSQKSARTFVQFSSPQGQHVFGYTTTDGRFHRVAGRARLVADTMVFHRPEVRAHGLTKGEPAITERVPVADLKSVRIESIEPFRTTLLVGVLAGVAAVIVWAGFYIAGMNS